MVALDEEFEAEQFIGGPGTIVEIDECKIGRRKYHRGRVVEGNWILGMIERGNPSAYCLEICPNRSLPTLTAHQETRCARKFIQIVGVVIMASKLPVTYIKLSITLKIL